MPKYEKLPLWRQNPNLRLDAAEKDATELEVLRFLENRSGYPLTADMILNVVVPLVCKERK